jgi:hypothetical protein
LVDALLQPILAQPKYDTCHATEGEGLMHSF